MTRAGIAAAPGARDVATAVNALRAQGLRLSSARRVLLEVLYGAERPISAEEIAAGGDRLPPSDLASVYRNLERLEELGLVRHVHLGHGPGRYLPDELRPGVRGLRRLRRVRRGRPRAPANAPGTQCSRRPATRRASPTSRSSGRAPLVATSSQVRGSRRTCLFAGTFMHPARAVTRSGGQRQRPQEGTCARSPPSSRQQPSRAAASAVPVTGVFGSSHREAPQIMLDPSADNTDLYAFTAPDAPDRADDRRELDPARGSGRRAELRQARPEGPLPRQDRQHRRRRRGRRLPLAVHVAVPQPGLVPVRARRWYSIDDANLNFVQTYDL